MAIVLCDMNVADPRKGYDDLLEKRVEEPVDEETFTAMRQNEAFNAGWAVAAIVLDNSERILLAYHDDDEAWLLPGGSVQPGESLQDAVVREVDDETGVSSKPIRPQAIVENVITNDGEELSFAVVIFLAQAISTTIGEQLGEPGEPIADADWFAELPENMYEREIAKDVVDRVTQ